MPCRVEFSKRAAKQFKALPRQVQERFKPRIDLLQEAPLPPGAVKLQGADRLYRLRVGDYRLIYEIQDEVLVILILKVGHRRNVYQ